MARKPKAVPSAAVAERPAPAGDTVAPDAPMPSRRGRKPKAAAVADTGMAGGSSSAATKPSVRGGGGAVEVPARGRGGRRPKQQSEAAIPGPRQGGKARKAGRDALVEGPANDDEGSSGRDAPKQAASDAEVVSAGVVGAGGATPAARWDSASDTAEFDWDEIGRTASAQGPNQVMAKLLIAARAEGANSRWPL